MVTFFLIRHAEKVPTPGNPGLSELGEKQARQTAEFLAPQGIDVVVASPKKRAQQTAEYIVKTTGATFTTTPQLTERMNWGDIPGQHLSDFLEMWAQSNEDRDWQPPTGDSSQQVGKRVIELMESLLKTPAQKIALVAHGGVITDTLRSLFGDELLEAKQTGWIMGKDDFCRYASISTITFTRESGWKLEKLYSTEHLQS